MAIVFNCNCGKQMRAPENFAGRRLTCKACGKVVKIPSKSDNSPPNHTAPAAPPPMPETTTHDRPGTPTMAAPVGAMDDDATIADEPAMAMFEDAPMPQAAEPTFVQPTFTPDDDETVSMAAPVEEDDDEEDDENEDDSPLARPVAAKSATRTSALQGTLAGQMLTEWADGREQQPDLPRGGRGLFVFLLLVLIAGVAGAAVYFWDELPL